MKKILITVVPILVIISMLAMAIPVVAQTVETEVGILGTTGGDPPIIKAKWETPDDYPTPGPAGTQIDPPLEWEDSKEVCYWAIVTDPQGKSNIAAVYVDVFHPAGPPENGSFKYQLQLTVQDKADTIDDFEQAVTDGTIVINSPFTVEEIREELTQCSADIYKICGTLYYEQPAGDYEVIIKAVDKQGNATEFHNFMTYVAAAGIELDFDQVFYGTVTVCDNQLIDGNTTWDPAAPQPAGVGQTNQATVRNIGNTEIKVTIASSDLYNGSIDLGMTGTDWNVEYDARVGHLLPYQIYYPSYSIKPGAADTTPDPITLDQVIGLSTMNKLDLSIHVKKFGTTGTWNGTMTLGAVIDPF